MSCSCSFESSEQFIIPVTYAMQFVLKVWFIVSYLSSISGCLVFPSFFSRLIRFCIDKIWMDKSSVLNLSFIYFQTKIIKLAFQMSHIYSSLQSPIIFPWITRLCHCLLFAQENCDIFWKKFNQYFVSQVQSLKDHFITVKLVLLT